MNKDPCAGNGKSENFVDKQTLVNECNKPRCVYLIYNRCSLATFGLDHISP
jgi:hypothetical protein